MVSQADRGYQSLKTPPGYGWPAVPLLIVARVMILAVGLLGVVHAEGAPDPGVPAPVEGLRFFAVGDLPYHRAEEAPLKDLLKAAASKHPAFIVHVGDIKSGSSPCTDEQLRRIAAIFASLPVPVVYSPGDNEWTDCHRKDAGGLDPRERLVRLREIFFADPTVLRLATLGVVRASEEYPEIYAFVVDEVLFVALHLVGSGNGLDADYKGAKDEFEARDAVNQAFLSRMLDSPAGRSARALVIMMQADPLFGSGKGPKGFRGFKRQLVATLNQFPGPVLLVHGDTHQFQYDHPLLDPARDLPFERFTRVEVPASPQVGGVWIRVDPGAAEPFVAEPVYGVSLETLGH